MNEKNRIADRQSYHLSLYTTTMIKGIAIIMVVLTHCRQSFRDLPSIIHDPLSFFQLGAQIFLILSSYGLCCSYSKKRPKYSSYIWHRYIKTGVSYWLAIILYLIISFLSYLLFNENRVGNTTEPLAVLCNVLMIHGLIPISGFYNSVVRGGWFIGTIVLFYYIFPFLYRVYYFDRLLWWKKYRRIVFPLILQIIAFILVYCVGRIDDGYICENNSFVYFSVINQLPCISLGFSLYDICHGKKLNVRLVFLKMIICFFAVICLFFYSGNSEFLYRCRFILIPLIFGGFFIYLLVLCNRFIAKKDDILMKSRLIRIIHDFGVYSFGIYLIHPFFAYELERFIINNIYLVLFPSGKYRWYIFTFLSCIVIALTLSYYSGRLFNLLTKKLYSYLNK